MGGPVLLGGSCRRLRRAGVGSLTGLPVKRYDKSTNVLHPVIFKLEATDEVSQIQYTPVR